MTFARYFTLAELTRTSTGRPNQPSATAVERLRWGAQVVLDKLRERVGRLRVTSGYRSPEVDRAVGGSGRGQHTRGEAADLVPLDASREKLWAVVREFAADGLIDQGILYERTNHVHVSWAHGRDARSELLVRERDGSYVHWHAYTGPLKAAAPEPPRAPEPVPRTLPPAAGMAASQAATAKEAPVAAIIDTSKALDTAKTIALEELEAARARAFAAFLDGQITTDELEEQLALLLKGAVRIGEETLAQSLALPAVIEPLAQTGLQIAVEKAGEAVVKLAKRVVEWVDDLVGPNARRLVRRITELERDDALDGIIGDDRPQRMYRLAERLVRKFPAAAAANEIAFNGRQLVLDGAPWGEPPDGFDLKAA